MEDEGLISELPEIKHDSEDETGEFEESIHEDIKPKRPKKRFDIKNQGIRIRQAKISFLYNYILFGLMSIMMFLAWNQLNLTFTTSPQNVGETMKTAFVVIMGAIMLYLVKEPVIMRKFKTYVITNNEVIKVDGIFRKNRIIIPYQSISNIDVFKGVVGRMLNFGDVTVVGFKNKIIMEGIKDPDLFYRIINNKIAIIRGVKQTVVQERKISKRKPKGKLDWRKSQKEVDERMKKKVKRKKKVKKAAKRKK